MIKIRVRHQTLTDDTHKGLLGRIESVVEALRNRGDKIIAVTSSPMPLRETVAWTATIFHEYEVDE